MKVILTGGGTGGHLYPGLAIVEALKCRTPCQVLFIGTKLGLEAKIVPQKGYLFKTVWIRGLRRGHLLKNMLFPIRMVFSLLQAIVIVQTFKPEVLVGTGGYVSWPVLSAGLLLRYKTVIQEQNKAPGLVTRLLAPYVNSVHLSFEASKQCFRKKENLHFSGNPTRADLEVSDPKEAYQHFGFQAEKPVLFIFGGSQGARSINRAFLKIVNSLLRRSEVQILWATGSRWFEGIQDQIKGENERIKLFPYLQEMDLAYAVTDLLVCRAGATTVAEVARLGIPAIFIPFPAAAGGHQEENARALLAAGAGEMVLEDQAIEQRLEETIQQLLINKKRRETIGERVKDFGKPNAAELIVDDILNIRGSE